MNRLRNWAPLLCFVACFLVISFLSPQSGGQAIIFPKTPSIFDPSFYRRTYSDVATLSDKAARAHWDSIGFGEGRRSHAGPRIMKIVLMTKDEWPLVRSWVLHHAHIFGPRNVYVIDSSAADGPTARFLDEAALYGVNVMRTQLNLNNVLDAINHLFRLLAHSTDFIIKLDTDELLLRWNGTALVTTGLVEYLDSIPVTGALLKVGGAGENAAPSSCGDRNNSVVLASRHFILVDAHPAMGRKFFSGPSFKTVDLGAHKGEVQSPFDALPSEFVPNLRYAHYHQQCYDITIANSLRAIISHGYLDPSEPSEVQREKLAQRVATSNFPRGSIHKAAGYLEHLNDEGGTRARHEEFANYVRSSGVFVPEIAALAECLEAAYTKKGLGYDMGATGCAL